MRNNSRDWRVEQLENIANRLYVHTRPLGEHKNVGGPLDKKSCGFPHISTFRARVIIAIKAWEQHNINAFMHSIL